jgi:hypothetical protein
MSTAMTASEAMRALWEDPARRAEVEAKLSAAQRLRWADPERRAKLVEAIRRGSAAAAARKRKKKD